MRKVFNKLNIWALRQAACHQGRARNMPLRLQKAPERRFSRGFDPLSSFISENLDFPIELRSSGRLRTQNPWVICAQYWTS